MIKYYIPFGWLINTRINKFSILNLVTLFMNYMFPSIIFVLYSYGISMEILISYFLVFVSMYMVYECGYMYNDLITVRYESNPTKRIKDIDLVTRHLEILVTTRLIFSGVTLWLFCEYYFGYERIVYIILGVVGLLLSYSFHNFFRGKVNMLTFCSVVHFKFLIPLVPFFEMGELLCIYMMLLFTVIIEQTVCQLHRKKLFKLEFLNKENKDKIRFIYSVLILGINSLFYTLGYIDFQFIIFVGIWSIYRGLVYAAMNFKSVASLILKRRTMHDEK